VRKSRGVADRLSLSHSKQLHVTSSSNSSLVPCSSHSSSVFLSVVSKHCHASNMIFALIDVLNGSVNALGPIAAVHGCNFVIIIYLLIKHIHIDGRKQDNGTGQQGTHSMLTVVWSSFFCITRNLDYHAA